MLHHNIVWYGKEVRILEMYSSMKRLYIRFKELGNPNSLINVGKYFVFENDEYRFKNIEFNSSTFFT